MVPALNTNQEIYDSANGLLRRHQGGYIDDHSKQQDQSFFNSERFRNFSSFLNGFYFPKQGRGEKPPPVKEINHCWSDWSCSTSTSTLLSCGTTTTTKQYQTLLQDDDSFNNGWGFSAPQAQILKSIEISNRIIGKSCHHSIFDELEDTIADKNNNEEDIEIIDSCTTQQQQLVQEDEDDEIIGEDIVVPAKSQEEFSILGVSSQEESDDSNDYYPDSTILSPSMMDAFRPHLPLSIQEDNFWLKYSMIRDGACMRTLLQKSQSSKRTILVIETMEGDIFGAFTSSPWRINGSRGYFGSCEAFVWRIPESKSLSLTAAQEKSSIKIEEDQSIIQVFNWSGKNCNIQALVNENRQLIIGGGVPDDDNYSSLLSGMSGSLGNKTGDEEEDEEDSDDDDDRDGGCSLIINADMINGSSSECATFSSPPLVTTKTTASTVSCSTTTTSTTNEFQIVNIEVWSFTPFDTVDEAEKLEHGMQFQVDHRCNSYGVGEI